MKILEEKKCCRCAKEAEAHSGGKSWCNACLKVDIKRALAWDDVCWSLGIGRWGQ